MLSWTITNVIVAVKDPEAKVTIPLDGERTELTALDQAPDNDPLVLPLVRVAVRLDPFWPCTTTDDDATTTALSATL